MHRIIRGVFATGLSDFFCLLLKTVAHWETVLPGNTSLGKKRLKWVCMCGVGEEGEKENKGERRQEKSL